MIETKPGPLKNVTVLDFTWVLAGPHAAKALTDLGANVIKVEMYKNGAAERSFPYRVTKNEVMQSSYSINNNRGKKSVCINIKTPRGQKVIHDLIRKSDVLLENFAPGVMERLKLDYESVRKVKEDIVYCSISCFGHWGPYSHKPGYDIIAQAASGWIDQMDPSSQAPVSIGDMNASMHATTAILAALIHHKETGEGQNIDISMMDCLFCLHENTLPWYLISSAVNEPIQPPRVGKHHPGYAPYGVYKGKNGNIAIALLTDLRWQALLNVLGSYGTHLRTDPRVATVSIRCTTENCHIVHDALEKWVMAQDSVEKAESLLEEAGIPCLRVRGIVELADEDPQVKARGMMLTVPQPFIGPMKMYGSPMKLSHTPSGIRGYAPFLGEHNYSVLQDLLEYSPEEINKLYQEDILHHERAVEQLEEKSAHKPHTAQTASSQATVEKASL